MSLCKEEVTIYNNLQRGIESELSVIVFNLFKHAPIKHSADHYKVCVMDAFAQLGMQGHKIGAVVTQK